MRAHDEPLVAGHQRHPSRPAPEAGEAEPVAAGGGGPLTPAAVAHLQRTAGNASVARLLDDEQVAQEPSPVKDVVGSGGGRPLDPGTRSFMESRLGHDFGDVRIHTDSRASESAASVQATAYTVGRDVVFGSDQWAPETDRGRRMLAHELTHVVQQASGPVDGMPAAGGIRVSDPSDRFEREAEASADQVMARPGVQRQEDEEELQATTAQLSAVQRQEETEVEDEE